MATVSDPGIMAVAGAAIWKLTKLGYYAGAILFTSASWVGAMVPAPILIILEAAYTSFGMPVLP